MKNELGSLLNRLNDTEEKAWNLTGSASVQEAQPAEQKELPLPRAVLQPAGDAAPAGPEPALRMPTAPDDESVTASGDCGDGLTYSLRGGVLTVSGSGEVLNLSRQDPPFEALAVRAIVLSDGVEGIGIGAFSGCQGVQTLWMADSVKRIGEEAFRDCQALKTLKLSKSLTRIEKGAFFGCGSLTELSLPAAVKEIGEGAFLNCGNLKRLYLQRAADTIGERAFGFEIKEREGDLAFSRVSGFVLCCDKNSVAEAWAKENGLPARIQRLTVVSLGDSYSSGEGISPFGEESAELSERIKDEDWLAHRSRNSWPGMLKIPGVEKTMSNYRQKELAPPLPEESGGIPKARICWYFFAGSGAVTSDFYTGQIRHVKKGKFSGDYRLTPQLKILDTLKSCGEHVDYVTLTVGGNDIGFARIISDAATENGYLRTKLKADLDAAWEKFETGISKEIQKLLRDIREKTDRDTVILFAGYPQLIEQNEKSVFFSPQEADMINENVRHFNLALEQLVRRMGDPNLHFIDVMEKFVGHRAYAEFSPWINPVILPSKKDDLEDQPVSGYSMHPNLEGAIAYAARVNETIERVKVIRKG